MNVAIALWGCVFAAPHAMIDAHFAGLMTLFADEVHAGGGPKIDADLLTLNLDLYGAMIAIFYFLASPSRILMRLPEIVNAADALDPILLNGHESARNQLHAMITTLGSLRALDLDKSLGRILEQAA